jgi:hypothetical protein
MVLCLVVVFPAGMLSAEQVGLVITLWTCVLEVAGTSAIRTEIFAPFLIISRKML